MDHCILRPLYPLFSPCQWSLTALRTISDIEDEDGEKSGENCRRPRAQLWRIDKARERGNNTGTAAGSSEGGLPRHSPASSPRLASVVTRREYRAITALRTRWRWRGFQAHVGLRLSSWQFTVFARSLARSFAIRTCGTGIVPRISRASPLPSSYRAVLQLSRVNVSLSLFFFNIPRPCAFISPMIFVFDLLYAPLARSPARSFEGEKFLSMACFVRSSRSTTRSLPPPRVSAENNRDLTVWHFANFECDSSRLNSNIDLLNNRCRDVH